MSSVHRDLGFGQRRLRTCLAGLALFQLLLRHQVAQATVTPCLTLSLGQGFLALGQGRLGVAQRQLETVLVDGEQHVATLDHLVVADLDLLDQPGHVRGNLDHVGTDMPVPRPGGEHVIHDHLPDQYGRQRHYQQGQDHAAQGQ
ncbi:hypothetical protein D9M73_239240 [compost metagenome]